MGYFIDSQGNYYEGDRASLSDKGVPQRPSAIHIFVDGEWIEDVIKVATIQAEEQRVVAKAQSFINNLPSWLQVKAYIDIAFPDEKQNTFITKLARVVYWDIKGTEA